MELNEMQDQVDEWITQNVKTYASPMNIMVQITEEVGELAREINHNFVLKKKEDSEEENSIGAEIGDIMVLLCCLANPLKINLDEEFRKTMKKIDNRDIMRYKNGNEKTN